MCVFFICYHPFASKQETFQDPSEINIDSEDFKALPPEIQHELIKEVQAERKWMSKNNFHISKVCQSWKNLTVRINIEKHFVTLSVRFFLKSTDPLVL